MPNTFTTAERAVAERTGRLPSRRQPRELPSIPLETASTRVRKSAAEVIDLTARLTAADAEVKQAEAQVPAAEAADLDAEALSVRDGKPARVTERADAAREALELRRRDHAALERALDLAVQDLERLIGEDRGRWLGAVAEKLNRDVAAARTALETLEAGLGVIAQDLALRRWIETFPSSKTFRPIAIAIGDGRASDVVACIASALEEIARPPAVERPTHLQPTNDEMEGASA